MNIESEKGTSMLVGFGDFSIFLIFYFCEKSSKTTFWPNLAVLAPEKDSSGDLEEIPQKIVQIDALAATFWAKTKFSKFSIF